MEWLISSIRTGAKVPPAQVTKPVNFVAFSVKTKMEVAKRVNNGVKIRHLSSPNATSRTAAGNSVKRSGHCRSPPLKPLVRWNCRRRFPVVHSIQRNRVEHPKMLNPVCFCCACFSPIRTVECVDLAWHPVWVPPGHKTPAQREDQARRKPLIIKK